MKTKILSILLLLCILCLSSCQEAISTQDPTKGTEETTTPPPQEPAEPTVFTPEFYVPYVNSCSFDLELNPLDIPGVEEYLDEWPLYSSEYTTEENIPDLIWRWGDMELNVEYKYSGYVVFGKIRNTYTRYYRLKEDSGWIGIDVETGKWVMAHFAIADFIDQNPTGEKLTQEECRVIAQQHVDNYIATVGTDINPEEYTLREMDLQSSAQRTPFYNFVYEKFIDGHKTNDQYYCGISEYGTLVTFLRGDSYDATETLLPKMETAYVKLNQMAQLICDYYPEYKMTYTLGTNRSLYKLSDGTYMIRVGITFLQETGEEIGSMIVNIRI